MCYCDQIVTAILTRVVSLSVEQLRDTMDTVHRLGKPNTAVTNNTWRNNVKPKAMFLFCKEQKSKSGGRHSFLEPPTVAGH